MEYRWLSVRRYSTQFRMIIVKYTLISVSPKVDKETTKLRNSQRFFMLWFMKLPPGKHGKWHFRTPKKTFSQTPREARDSPSCAYLNGKTTLRPCIQDILSLIPLFRDPYDSYGSWTLIYPHSPSNDTQFINCTTRKPFFHDPYEVRVVDLYIRSKSL